MMSQCLGWYVLLMLCSSSASGTHNIAGGQHGWHTIDVNSTRAHVHRQSDAIFFGDIIADGVLEKDLDSYNLWLIKLRPF